MGIMGFQSVPEVFTILGYFRTHHTQIRTESFCWRLCNSNIGNLKGGHISLKPWVSQHLLIAFWDGHPRNMGIQDTEKETSIYILYIFWDPSPISQLIFFIHILISSHIIPYIITYPDLHQFHRAALWHLRHLLTRFAHWCNERLGFSGEQEHHGRRSVLSHGHGFPKGGPRWWWQVGSIAWCDTTQLTRF